MTRKEYEYNQHALRRLLHNLSQGDFLKRVQYRYALQFNPLFGYYHLWDGAGLDEEHQEPLTLATLKLRPKSVIIRHRPEFQVLPQLLKFTLPDRESKFVVSENINRHDDWVHQRIQSRVERRMQERASFLDNQNLPPFTIQIEVAISNIPQTSSGTTTGLEFRLSPEIVGIRLQFNSQEELDRHKYEAREMIERLATRFGIRLDLNRVWGFSEIEELFRTEQVRYDTQRRIERQMLESQRASIGTAAQQYVADYSPGQLLEYMNTSNIGGLDVLEN